MGLSHAQSKPCIDLCELINLIFPVLAFGGCLVTSHPSPVSPSGFCFVAGEQS